MKVSINNKIFSNESKIITYICDKCSKTVNCKTLYTCQDGNITHNLCKKCFDYCINENMNFIPPSPSSEAEKPEQSSTERTKKEPKKSKYQTNTTYVIGGNIILGIPVSHSCTRDPCGKLIEKKVQMYDINKNHVDETLFECPICHKRFIHKDINLKIFSKQYTFWQDENTYSEKYSEKSKKQRYKHKRGTVIHLISSHKCGSNEYIIKSYNDNTDSYTLICRRCRENIILPSNTLSSELLLHPKPQKTSKNNLEDFSYLERQNKKKHSSSTNTSISKHTIEAKQVLVMVNTFHCTIDNHILEDIILIINVISSNGTIKKIEYPGAYCATCRKYFILNEDFRAIKKIGIPVCRVVDIYHKTSGDGFFDSFNNESLLHMLGYNVNAQVGLSTESRWNILERIVDADILTKNEICSHLDFLINRSKRNNLMNNAISKWKIDRDHISQYHRQNLEKIEVLQFKRNIYK